MDEHGFIKAVHRRLLDGIKVWKIRDNLHGGVSDALYFGTHGRLLFVEYKYAPKLPVKDGSRVFDGSVTALQLLWFRELKSREVPVAFVFGAEDRALVLYTDEFAKGMTKADFERQAMSLDQVALEISTSLLL